MEYKHIKTDKKEESILISADGFGIWIDYWKACDGYEWDFNQFIFCNWKASDKKAQRIQNEIMQNDFENFNYFIDCILENIKEEEKNEI